MCAKSDTDCSYDNPGFKVVSYNSILRSELKVDCHSASKNIHTCQLFKIFMGDFARSDISQKVKFMRFVVMLNYSTIL